MSIISFILAIICGSIIFPFLDRLIYSAVEASLLNYYLWFLIPVGTVFIGIFSALPSNIILRKKQKLPSKNVILAVCLAAFLGVFIYNWFDFQSIYFDNDSGENLYLADYISYPDYLKAKYSDIEFDEINFGTRNKIDANFGLGKFSYVVIVLELVSAPLAAYLFLSILTNSKYCSKCNKYYESKSLRLTALKKESLDELINNFDQLKTQSASQLLDFLREQKAKKKGLINNNYSIEVTTSYCPDCKQSVVEVILGQNNKALSKYLLKENDANFLDDFLDRNYKL